MILTELPVEILLDVLVRLPRYQDLLSFSATNHVAHSVTFANIDFLIKALTFDGDHNCRQEPSSGSAGLRLINFSPSSTDLSHLINYQKLLSKEYYLSEGLQTPTWLHFAKKFHTLAQNWRQGRHTFRPIPLALSLNPQPTLAEDGIWRFKIDCSNEDGEGGTIVTSGAALTNGTQVWDEDGNNVWSTRLPHVNWPHIEVSDGYLATHLRTNKFIIWRRNSLLHTSPPLIPPSPRAYPTHASASSPSQHYHPYCSFTSPQQCTATKARYPLFVCVSPAPTPRHPCTAYIYDIPTGTLKLTVVIDGITAGVTYVDFDSKYLFVAFQSVGTTVIQYDLDEGTFSLRGKLPDNNTPREWGVCWSALHLSLDGTNLVAICGKRESARLLWIKNYWDYLAMDEGDRERNNKDVMILKLPGRVEIHQLSVENGRAVFVAGIQDSHFSDPRFCLFLLNLTHDSVPNLLEICPALPIFKPPSRVEQTSSAIYLPIQISAIPVGIEAAPDSFLSTKWKWVKISGEEVHNGGGKEMDSLRSEWLLPPRSIMEEIIDGIAEFSFEVQWFELIVLSL